MDDSGRGQSDRASPAGFLVVLQRRRVEVNISSSLKNNI
jgi:hypothetical protein